MVLRTSPIMLSVLTCMILVMCGIILLQSIKQEDMYWINRFSLGLDYHDFYQASLAIVDGKSPYTSERYVTTPIPAILNIPLSQFWFKAVRQYISLFVFISVFLALFLSYRIFHLPNPTADLTFIIMSSMTICLSYPFIFLFDRGNIDGFVLLFLCSGLFFLGKWDGVAGVLFALSIAFKVYPILVILPLFTQRRWKSLFFLGGTLLFLFILAPMTWIEFFQERLLTRSSSFRLDENGSFAYTFYFMGNFFDCGLIFQKASSIIYIFLLLVVVYIDFRIPSNTRQELCTRALMYIPFMVVVPKLVYHYEYVCVLALLPMLSWLWENTNQLHEKKILIFMTIGVVLSQFQAVATEKLFKQLWPHFIPGLGLLILVLGVSLYKCFLFVQMKEKQISCESKDIA